MSRMSRIRLAALAALWIPFGAWGEADPVVVVVDNTTAAINGNTANIESLIRSPGPDGISFPEAWRAANGTSGPKVITFAPDLLGATIEVTTSAEDRQLFVFASPDLTIDAKKKYTATIETTAGSMVAELFASEGAKVLINDLDGDVAEEAAREIDGETAVFAGDLTRDGVPDELVKAATEAFDSVDILVNNAGYTWDGVVHRMSDEQFQAMLDIHTIVPFRMIRALAPAWREAAKAERAEGREVFRKIVNVSSISGTMGNAGQANYSAAKAGVTGLTKTIAKEWGQFKINCNAVAFGFVETRLTQAKEKGETMKAAGERDEQVELGVPEQMRQMASMMIPLGRPAQPIEAAGPVLFLCSALGNYVHGQVINVTGGQFTGMYM